MRKSLSESAKPKRDVRLATWFLGGAVCLSAALAVAGGIDQAGGQSLLDHATTIYAPHGEDADPALLYGLIYFVAVIGMALWLLVLRAVRAGKSWSAWLAGAAVALTVVLAGTLLTATEYDARIFPPMWGALAGLPGLPGIAVLWSLLSRDEARSRGPRWLGKGRSGHASGRLEGF